MALMNAIVSPGAGRCVRLGFAGAVLVAAAFVAGCSIIPTPPPDLTRYYVLSGPETPPTANRSPEGPVVILASLEVPGYLRTTRNLVMRSAKNEVTFVDGARWGEALETGLARLLRETLVREGGASRVVQPPVAAALLAGHPAELRVQVLTCEARRRPDGGWVAAFSARYEWVRPGAVEPVSGAGVFVADEGSWDGRDHGELARLLSEAAQALGRDIAERMGSAP